MPSEAIIGAWVAAGLTLMIFSFLYRDNPLYKLAEHLYVGVGMGYFAVTAFKDTIISKVGDALFGTGMVERDYWLVLPCMLGMLLFLRFHPKSVWVSRYAFAVLMGIVAGIAIPAIVGANIIAQLKATIQPYADVPLTVGNAIDATIILAGVITILVYFYFSREQKGVLLPVSKIGIAFLMVMFGAHFGLTVMGRVTLLIGRFTDLGDYARADYRYATWCMLAACLLFLFLWRVTAGREKKEATEEA